MKLILVELLTVTVLACSLASASPKVCFGAKNNEYTNGAVLTLDADTSQLAIKTVKVASEFAQDLTTDQAYNGAFTALNKIVKGKDENLYLTYEGLTNGEQQDVVLVDSKLLNKNTTGLLKIRATGEAFAEGIYVCKDQN